MPGRQAAPGHAGRLRRRSPLIRVESGGMKQIRGRRRIAPFAVLKCRHVEMHKHAETQIHKPLLQIEERPSATRSYPMHFVLFRRSTVIARQHRSRRRLGSQPEELSSRRHLRCSSPGWKGAMIPWNPGLWASRTTLYAHLPFLTLAFFAGVKTE
jgi:hypothetical protein